MAKILINDGIHPTGLEMLRDAGHEVSTDRIEQNDLVNQLPNYDAICVRSATKVRQPLIEACPNLRVIGRGGVGLDNIDVDFAKSKGIAVINTPAASSRSVAELVFSHIFALARSIHTAGLEMPSQGNAEFKKLKKSYSKGYELKGKTIGVIGTGGIGQEVIKIALGLGLNVVTNSLSMRNKTIKLDIANLEIDYDLNPIPLNDLLKQSDIVTVHIPSADKPLISSDEFDIMKNDAIVINTSRGGFVDEEALLSALEGGKIAGAGLDVFVNEPKPNEALLQHPKISVTPHIGGSTQQAQENVGIELAQKLIDAFK